jgi:hypothetical protein
MKAKHLLSLLFLALLSTLSYANDDIPLRQGNLPNPGDPTNPRSIEIPVTASIDGQVVTVSFSELTESQIVVTDSAELTVYNHIYAPACSVQANLNSLPSGSYTLHIYAFGVWWYGDFVLQ